MVRIDATAAAIDPEAGEKNPGEKRACHKKISFVKPEAVGCHGHDHGDGGHSGEQGREQEGQEELGSRIGVAIATLALASLLYIRVS